MISGKLGTWIQNAVPIVFCLWFATKVEARSELSLQTLKKRIIISSPAARFYWEKLTSLHLIYWQWANSVAWQYRFSITWRENILKPPKNVFFPATITSTCTHPYMCLKSLVPKPQWKLNGWKPFRAERLPQTGKIYCDAKSEQMVH